MRGGGTRDGEADGVVDMARRDLVVAQQPGQDRKPGGVGRGPAVRPQRVGLQVVDGAAAGPSSVRPFVEVSQVS